MRKAILLQINLLYWDESLMRKYAIRFPSHSLFTNFARLNNEIDLY